MDLQRDAIIEFLGDHWRKTKASTAIRGIAREPEDADHDHLLLKLEELRKVYIDELAALTDEQLLSALSEALDEQERDRSIS